MNKELGSDCIFYHEKEVFQPHVNAIIQNSVTSGSQKWVNTGIQNLSVSTIIPQVNSLNSHVKGPDDFKKVTYDEMVEGFRKLQEVILPAVKNGATAETFSQIDSEKGLYIEHGYRKIYDAFYGDDCIRVNKTGNNYDVINGYHRLFVAKELGIENIPIQVIERTE